MTNEGDNEFREPNTSNPDQLPFIEKESHEHPTPEQLLMKLAIDRVLMRDQKKLWELHNYSRLNKSEIARKLHTSEKSIRQRIKVIEKLLTKFCLDHASAITQINESGC